MKNFVYNIGLKRNLLYSLISAIEFDLRSEIKDYNIPVSYLGKAKDRYKKEFSKDENSISVLIDYLDLSDLKELLDINKNNLKPVFYEKISQSILDIVPVRNRVMHSRPLLPNDESIVFDFIYKMNSLNEHFSSLFKAINDIKNDKSYLFRVDRKTIEEDKVIHNLPLVDYDDTGFIGRIKNKKELIKKIYGPYPVISIIGDGGIGKTSLLLSCMYDLIDDPDFSYNTIAWTTLKTTSLQDGDFKHISGSISNFDMVIKGANMQINNDYGKPQDDMLTYMRYKKTILIIDNLETINSNDIKDFLENLPPESKVIITSRIGVGEFETRYKLEGFTKSESIQYLRFLSSNYQVSKLLKSDNELLAKYAEQLHYFPLFMKWFVINVGKGTSISELLVYQKDLITFSMSNVYNALSEKARFLLITLLFRGNSSSSAELLYISGYTYDNFTDAINELFKCNFVDKTNADQFFIPNVPGKYLRLNKQVMNANSLVEVRQKSNKLEGLLDNLKVNVKLTNPYHPLSYFPKNENDRIATVYMLSANEASINRNIVDFEKQVQLAIKSSPSFIDIYKNAAYLYSKFGNNILAEQNYQTALMLSNTNDIAYLYYHYSEFLAVQYKNYNLAISYLSKALVIKPKSFLIMSRLGRIHKMNKNFKDALVILESLIILEDLNLQTEKSIVRVYEELIDTKIRMSDIELLSFSERVLILEDAASTYLSIHSKYSDLISDKLMYKLFSNYIFVISRTTASTKRLVQLVLSGFSKIISGSNGNVKNVVGDIAFLLNLLHKNSNDYKNLNAVITPSSTNYSIGCVSKKTDKGYLFISDFSNNSVYLHSSNFGEDFRLVNEGDLIEFVIKKDEEGRLFATESKFHIYQKK